MESEGIKMKIALVCSHGGHLTEMLYLMNAFEGHDLFFITYDSPRTRNLDYRKYLFPNFGERPFEVINNLGKILRIFAKEKPHVIISNGAEIAVPFFYISKILRIKSIFIECYTRVNEPTITGRLVYPISDSFIVLWPEMLSKYGKKAQFLGDFFLVINDKTSNKAKEEGCIFVTVGMHYLGFDRLVKAMDYIAGNIDDKVIMQIGENS
jgi:UDP-N-acetylglucosamine:LPS N-acetylglucosamine transferase